VLVWNPGDTIPLSAGPTLQVVRIRHDDPELPVLVVEDVAKGATRGWCEIPAR
jgi:hypothetical protein